MSDWLDTYFTSLASEPTPLPEGSFERFEEYYGAFMRRRSRRRRLLIGFFAALLILLPVSGLLLWQDFRTNPRDMTADVHGEDQIQVHPGQGDCEPALEALGKEAFPFQEPKLTAASEQPVFPSQEPPGTGDPSQSRDIGPSAQEASPSQNLDAAPQKQEEHVPQDKAVSTRKDQHETAVPERPSDPWHYAEPVPKKRPVITASLYGAQYLEATGQSFGGMELSAGVPAPSIPGLLYRYQHYAPLSFGVDAGYMLRPFLRVSSGVNVSMYKSVKWKYTQRVWYLGVPVRLDYVWHPSQKPASLYVGAGLLLEKGIYGHDGQERLAPDGWYLSATFDAGFQYLLLPRLSVFLEPVLERTMISPETPCETWRMGSKFVFTMRAGFRIGL